MMTSLGCVTGWWQYEKKPHGEGKSASRAGLQQQHRVIDLCNSDYTQAELYQKMSLSQVVIKWNDEPPCHRRKLQQMQQIDTQNVMKMDTNGDREWKITPFLYYYIQWMWIYETVLQNATKIVLPIKILQM